MKNRFLLLVFPILTIIFELLPFGVVLNFAVPDGEPPIRETYSYFDFTPFGYGNITPLLTAIISCVVLILMILYCKSGKYSLINIIKGFLLAGIVFSVMVSTIFGKEYFTPVQSFITVFLAAEFLILLFIKKPYEPIKQTEVIK